MSGEIPKKRTASPGTMQRTKREMRHYAEGAFAMLKLCRLEGIPSNVGVVERIAEQSGVSPPPDYGNENG